MTWPKLVATWIIVGFMFVIATFVNHRFYLLIAEETRSGYAGMEQSLAKSNEKFHKIYLDQTKEILNMMKTGQMQDKDTRALLESLERQLTDISIWVSGIQEKVDRQSDEPGN